MIHQTVTRVSLDSFRERAAGKKVILLYPWLNYRNLFLSHFLAADHSGLLYYRIPAEVTTPGAWVRGLIDDLAPGLAGFGAQVRHLPDDAAPDALGEALAADLAACAPLPGVLFVDEMDRVQLSPAFEAFFTVLVGALAPGQQLAISSRLLTHQPWYAMVAQGDAVILGTEHRKSDLMFTVETEPRPQLEVYALGQGYALINGQWISQWDGVLPRNLFFYLIDRPLVTRDAIFETFWPDLSIRDATNVFHVTKRKMMERINAKLDGTPCELTQYANGFYMPSAKIVRHYDAADFLEAVEQAAVAHSERQEEILYQQAIALYKAPFLQAVNMPWAVARRDQLRQYYAQALIGIGRIMQRRVQPEAALGYFARALREVPEREDIHREVMRLYADLGMIGDALAQYDRLDSILAQMLNIGPAPETRALRDQIAARG
jgi:DNA-binding SARP family transcriptional activator